MLFRSMMLAELPDKIERYRFLDISGMHRKEQGRTLKREHKRSVWIPLVLTLISVGTFCGAMIGGYYDRTGSFAGTTAWIILMVVLMVYIVLELLFMLGSGSWILQRTLNPEGTL